MGIFNSFGAMSGQFAAKQERAKVAAALVEELKTPENLAGLIQSLQANGVTDLVRQWTAGSTAPTTPETVTRTFGNSPLLGTLVSKTNMPVGVIRTSMTVLLPLTIHQLALGGQIRPDGSATGSVLADFDRLAKALA